MPYKLYISTLESPRGSAVISQTNPTPVPIRDFVLGNTLDTNIYLVDGLGAYDAASGAAGYSLNVGIGMPGEGASELNSTWTQITNGWNGNLAFTDSRLLDLFTAQGVNPIQPTLETWVTDPQSRIASQILIPIRIWRGVITASDLVTAPSPSNADGEYALGDGADSGSVTGLNLAAVPRHVFLNVRKPAGGQTMFASIVSGSITTAGFSFTLSGVTDAATYKLDYYMVF
jgi:hypothetical protein